MKLIDTFKKNYTSWKWLRQIRKELKVKLEENEERRKKEWKRFFNNNK